MHALMLDGSGVLTLENAPRPQMAGECLIRITMAGICGTDLQMLDGYATFTGTPGHEFVGVVEHAPADASRWMGKRVVGESMSDVECARGVRAV